MKIVFAIGLMMTLGVGFVGAHSNGQCPPHQVYLLVDLTAVTPGGVGTLYHRDYDNGGVPGPGNAPLDLSGNDWLYTESGSLTGLQSGNAHAVLGANWGHEHNCFWPTAAQRDLLWY